MKYLLLFLITACGQPGTIREFPDSETQAIVERFEAEIAPVGSVIVEYVDSLEYIAVGLCTVSYQEAPRVQLLRAYWETASDVSKEMLIYHELAHSKGIEHDERKDINDNPKSLMYPYSFQEDLYTENREAHINDLRRKISKYTENKL